MLVRNIGSKTRYVGATLVPGLNRLSPSDAESFKKAIEIPLNRKLIDSKEIEVVREEAAVSIAALSAEKAIELIKETDDVNLLGTFSMEEAEEKNRKTVIEAIDKQLDYIENPPEDEQVHKEE